MTRRSSLFLRSSDLSRQSTSMASKDAVLYLEIISAHELKKKQRMGVQDPYCKVYVGPPGSAQSTEGSIFRTKTHDNGGELLYWISISISGTTVI